MLVSSAGSSRARSSPAQRPNIHNGRSRSEYPYEVGVPCLDGFCLMGTKWLPSFDGQIACSRGYLEENLSRTGDL